MGKVTVMTKCCVQFAWLPFCVCHSALAASSDSAPRALPVPGALQTPSEARRLSFGRSGRIVRMDATIGARVRHGQRLALLDCSDAKAQLAIAEAEQEIQRLTFQKRTRPSDPTELQIATDRLALAETELRLAEDARSRLDSAFRGSGIVSKQEVEMAIHRAMIARLEASTAKRALDRLQEQVPPEEELENAAREKIHAANINRARYQISMCEILSPVDGTVTAVNARPGEMATEFKPVVDVLDESAKGLP